MKYFIFLQWFCPRPWHSATKALAEDLLEDLASTPLEQDPEEPLVQLQILEELGLMLGLSRTPFQASQARIILSMRPYQRPRSPAMVRWTEVTMVTQRRSARLSTSAPTTATPASPSSPSSAPTAHSSSSSTSSATGGSTSTAPPPKTSTG